MIRGLFLAGLFRDSLILEGGLPMPTKFRKKPHSKHGVATDSLAHTECTCLHHDLPIERQVDFHAPGLHCCKIMPCGMRIDVSWATTHLKTCKRCLEIAIAPVVVYGGNYGGNACHGDTDP